MEVVFAKYQGTGNDFIMLDNLKGIYNNLSLSQITQMCDRRFGVGADGLIRINAASDFDFEVDYFNSDGSKSFCGNGARCAVAFAETLGFPVASTLFKAIDGEHRAYKQDRMIKIEMKNVFNIEKFGQDYILNTGSPHYVCVTKDLDNEDILSIGKKVRYSDPFRLEGINVNILQEKGDGHIGILTYERGVEDETFSCGTGATACAIVYASVNDKKGFNEVKVDVKGGQLLVGFIFDAVKGYSNVTLTGPAEYVFSGKMNV